MQQTACDWLNANTDWWLQWKPEQYCEKNYYSNFLVTGTTACVKCEVGKDSLPGFGVEACSNCTPGRYNWKSGEDCTVCPAGSYMPGYGSKACTACPDKASRVLDNCDIDDRYCVANSVEHCMCNEATYHVDGSDGIFECVECPKTKLAFAESPSAECEGGQWP